MSMELILLCVGVLMVFAAGGVCVSISIGTFAFWMYRKETKQIAVEVPVAAATPPQGITYKLLQHETGPHVELANLAITQAFDLPDPFQGSYRKASVDTGAGEYSTACFFTRVDGKQVLVRIHFDAKTNQTRSIEVATGPTVRDLSNMRTFTEQELLG